MKLSFAIIVVVAALCVVFVPSRVAAQGGAPKDPVQTSLDGAKITKSRSNIQNNRESAASAPKASASAASAASAKVVKTKTKSNQSND